MTKSTSFITGNGRDRICKHFWLFVISDITTLEKEIEAKDDYDQEKEHTGQVLAQTRPSKCQIEL